MTEARRAGPLEDLTIIDCTRALAGPYGAGFLADLGAKVIKVESPLGDIPQYTAFFAGPCFPGRAHCGYRLWRPFASVNRNNAVVLDFKKEDDKEVLYNLLADAVVENMRAGVMDQRLGVKWYPNVIRGLSMRALGLEIRERERVPTLNGLALMLLLKVLEDWSMHDNLVTPALADIFSGTLMGLGVVSAFTARKWAKVSFSTCRCTMR